MTTMMLYLAAALSVVIGLVHSWLGEVRLIMPLLAPENRQGLLGRSRFARDVLRFAWHLTTIAWWGIGVCFAVLAGSAVDAQGRMVLLVLGATMLVTGLGILAASRGRHLAWPVFLVIGVLAWVSSMG